jgi:hypothetical protein
MSDLISPEHTKAVGALVLAVSRLESYITSLLAGFMQIDIVRAIIGFHHQQLTNRIDTLLALMDLMLKNLPEDQLERIVGPVKAARDLANFRNTVVHAHWTKEPDGTVLNARFSARGTFERNRRPIDAKEIQTRAHEAEALAETLESLVTAFPARPISVPLN